MRFKNAFKKCVKCILSEISFNFGPGKNNCNLLLNQSIRFELLN
jgi:hypothetical protein